MIVAILEFDGPAWALITVRGGWGGLVAGMAPASTVGPDDSVHSRAKTWGRADAGGCWSVDRGVGLWVVRAIVEGDVSRATGCVSFRDLCGERGRRSATVEWLAGAAAGRRTRSAS
jgi:hypothetical protein